MTFPDLFATGTSKRRPHHPPEVHATSSGRNAKRPDQGVEPTFRSKGLHDQWSDQEGGGEGRHDCKACYYHCYEEPQMAAMSSCNWICVMHSFGRSWASGEQDCIFMTRRWPAACRCGGFV